MTLTDRSPFTNKQRIYDQLAKHDLDAVVVAQMENVVYCSGFYNFDLRLLPDRICIVVWPREGDPVFAVPDRRAASDGQMSFIEDTRGYTLLDGVFNPHPMEMVRDVLAEKGLLNGRIGYEQLYLPVFHADQLRKNLPDAELVSCDYVMDEIRMVKTPAEIEQLRFAAVQTEKAIANAYEFARPGDTEKQIVDHMGYAITKLGADFVFANVFAAGHRTPLGHHLAEEIRIQHGDIIRVDYGGSFDGYVSDLVRMAVVGKPNGRQAAIYGALSEGVGVHGFGHCIGLGIHDRPFITVDDDRLTEPNMVMQIEHITTVDHETYHVEDTVLFRENGVELLSDYTDTAAMYVID